MSGVSPEDLESSPGFLDAATAVVADDYLLVYDDSANSLRPATFANLAGILKKAAAGALIPTQQILTVGSGTYTTPAGCTLLSVRMVGAGGGGAGVAGHASQAAHGGPGGSGAYVEALITSPDATYAYSVSAGGAGGTAGANNGSAGAGDTTFGTALLAAPAGGGGFTMAVGTTVEASNGGEGGTAGSGGYLNLGGQPGPFCLRLSATSTFGAPGAHSPLGIGGNRAGGNEAGNAGTGYGSGGSGGCVRSVNTARAGGAGAPGLIIVTEFYG